MTAPAEPEWRCAHRELSRLARARAAMDAEEGRWLLCALRAATHVHLGFANFAQYIEHLLGYRPRSTEQKLRVAEALEELPKTRLALETGELNWSVVRELTRVARPETEQAWLEAARDKTARQIEALVSGKMPGDLPDSTSRPDARTHALHFEVSAETLALFREAVARLRRATDQPLDDDTILLLMARHVLGGPRDDGRASYQVALTVCEQCGTGWQQGSGELIEVPTDVIERAYCDAQHIGPVAKATLETTGTATAHVGESDKPQRARQDVPPRVRRCVTRRDGGRCVVPGCTHATWVDVHHIVARAAGGEHVADNLVCLCCAHHRAVHDGVLVIEGQVSTGLRFLRSDGSPYARLTPTPPSTPPANTDFRDQLALALCNMGFKQADVRGVVGRIHVGDAGDRGARTKALRQALELLSGGG